MKITRKQLKQIIKEEISNIVEAHDLQTLAGMKEQLDEATRLLVLASDRNPDPDLTKAYELVNAVAGTLALHTHGFGEPEEDYDKRLDWEEQREWERHQDEYGRPD